MEAELPYVAVGFVLSKEVDVTNTSADEAVVVRTEIEATVGSCAARVVSVNGVLEEAVEPPSVDNE